jgi:hypothetical protein
MRSIRKKLNVSDLGVFMGLFVKPSKLRGSDITTESNATDANIVIGACRNGRADLCAVHAIQGVRKVLSPE